MNLKEAEEGLESFKSLNFCGCGSPELGYTGLMQMLELHDRRSGEGGNWEAKVKESWALEEKFEATFGNSGLYNLILYFLDADELTEHGSSIGGAWLTDKGKKILAFLKEFGVDEDHWEWKIERKRHEKS